MADDRLHSEGLRDLAALHEAQKRIKWLEEREQGRENRPDGSGSGSSNGMLLKLILGGIVSLMFTFIVAGVYLYREVGELKAGLAENSRMTTENAQRINWLYQQIYNRERR